MTRRTLRTIIWTAYVLLGLSLMISRIANRPQGDTTSVLGAVASAVIYLACSLGIAWLLERCLRYHAPASTLAKQRRIKLRHLKRKTKEMQWGHQTFTSTQADQQQEAAFRQQMEARYRLGYERAVSDPALPPASSA